MDVTRSARRLVVVFPHPTSPNAVAVPPLGTCGACGLNLAHRSLAAFDPEAGVICADCLELRRGNLERCANCGALVELGNGGVRLIAGGGAVHPCKVADVDVYALGAQIRDERAFRRARAA